MSGLPDSYEADWSQPLAEMWKNLKIDTDEGARTRYVQSLADKKLLHGPGTQWEYSDLNYNLLGAVIEAVSGQSFESYMHDHIFAPLGMNHTSFTPTEIDPAFLAQPHVTGPNNQPVKAALYPYHRPWAPNVGLFSNAEDMARWMVVGFNRGEIDGVRILSPEAYDLLWGQQADTGMTWPDDNPLYYGLGWYRFQIYGKPVVGEAGVNLGFIANNEFFPDDGLGVIALGNRLDSADEDAYTDPVVRHGFNLVRLYQ